MPRTDPTYLDSVIGTVVSHYGIVGLLGRGRHGRVQPEYNTTLADVFQVQAHLSGSALQQAVERNPFNPISTGYLGYAHAIMGQRAEALALLQQLEATASRRYVPSSAMAMIHAGLGDRTAAFAWLERAYEERFNRLAYLRLEPVWAPLRTDPRFDDLLRRIGLPR